MSLLTNDHGSRRARRFLLIIVAAGIALAIALIAGLLVGKSSNEKGSSGQGHARKSTPPASPSKGSSREKTKLPNPETVKNGVPVGYPHTTKGAVAAAARYLQSMNPLASPKKLDKYVETSYVKRDQEKGKKEYRNMGRETRKTLDAPQKGPVPESFIATIDPKSYIVYPRSGGQVEVWILAKMDRARSGKPAETDTDAWPSIMEWSDGDWKETMKYASEKPKVAEPNTTKAAEAGWKQLVFTAN